jgi:hypothetical protein
VYDGAYLPRSLSIVRQTSVDKKNGVPGVRIFFCFYMLAAIRGRINPEYNPCELVHEDGNPDEIAYMLASRYSKGWLLDQLSNKIQKKLIDNMLRF